MQVTNFDHDEFGEPPRVRKFRQEIIDAIPRVPKNRESLLQLREKRFVDLMIDFVNWRSRYVGIRPRTVSIDPLAKVDPRWETWAGVVEAFLQKVRQGDDLTSHLSMSPHTRGYAAAARAPKAAPSEKWSDKDFILNIMGYHHFHLGPTGPGQRHSGRTNELLFAEVRRDVFKVIAIFDHGVFEQNSSERQRLWSVHDEIMFRDAAPSAVVLPTMIATSGHSRHIVRYAQKCTEVIREWDPKLDDPEFVRNLYPNPREAPAFSKVQWSFVHLDLAIEDAAKPARFGLLRGWN